MGSLQSVNCFERWGKRSTGGALLSLKKSTAATSVDSASTTESAADPSASAENEASQKRASRRRPSVAPPAMGSMAESDVSNDGLSVAEDDVSLNDSDEDVSASDIRAQKIAMYRKTLTRLVKLKFGFFASTVKMSVDKAATNLEWYNAKVKKDAKKLLGSIPLDKIKRVQQNKAKPHILEINQQGKADTYTVAFKTSEDRASWEDALNKLIKFVQQ